MLETLFQSLYVALSAVALAVILRNAPVISTWVSQMRKPWACNVCLPLYLCGLCVLGLVFIKGVWALLAYLPAYAISYLTLEKMSRPPAKLFVPPEMDLEEPLFPAEEVTPLERRKSQL